MGSFCACVVAQVAVAVRGAGDGRGGWSTTPVRIHDAVYNIWTSAYAVL